MLFQQNCIVSSMAGDFDHKSCWELLTDAQFTQKYFNAEERQVFRRHVLWTRLLSDRRTILPDGETASLLEYTRHEQETLVLKPNRSYGGDRVLIGPSVSTAAWEEAIQQAVVGDDQWVVQRLTRIPVSEFPVVNAAGEISTEPFYIVIGLTPTKYGVSIMGHA